MNYRERYEEEQKLKKKEKKAEESGISYKDRYEMEQISSRIDALSKSSQNLHSSYKSRFYDKDGNLIDGYRGDTADVLSSYKTEYDRVKADSKSILDTVTKYESYLGKDKAKEITSWLGGNDEALDGMLKHYQGDYDYYSQWKDKADYDSYFKQKAEDEKYSAMSSKEIEAEIDRLTKERDAYKKENGGELFNNLVKAGSYLNTITGESDRRNANAKLDTLNDYEAQIEKLNTYRTNANIKERVAPLDDETLSNLDVINEYGRTTDYKFISDSLSYANNGNKDTVAGILKDNEEIALQSEKKALRDIAYNKVYDKIKAKNPNMTDEEIEAEIEELRFLRQSQVDAQNQAIETAGIKEYAAENPGKAFAVSRIGNAIGGFGGLMELYLQRDNPYGIDTNAQGYMFNNASTSIDQQIQLDHDWNIDTPIGSVDGFDILYNVGTGVIDNTARMLMSGGNATISGALMGVQVLNQGIMDGKSKGYSDSKALTLGLLQATFEAVTEKASIEVILGDGGNLLKKIAKSFFAEGSEEVSANWLNNIADYIANGNHSEIMQLYNNYISSGYTESQALAEVVLSVVGEDVESFLVGGLAGAFLGGGVEVPRAVGTKIATDSINNKYYEAKGKNIISNDALAKLTEMAQGSGGKDTQKYLKLLSNQAIEGNIGELSNRQQRKYTRNVGKLYDSMQSENRKSFKEADNDAKKEMIENALKENGITDTSRATEVILKSADGKKLTRSEQQVFNAVEGKSILDSVVNSEELKTKTEEKKTEASEQYRFTEHLAKRIVVKDEELENIGGYDIADKVSIDSTGEEVEIVGVSSVDKNGISVDLSNGETVPLEALRVDVDTAYAMQSISALSKEGILDIGLANSILTEVAKGKIRQGIAFNPRNYVKGIVNTVRYGSISAEHLAETDEFAKKLDKDARKSLYEASTKLADDRLTEQMTAMQVEAEKNGINKKGVKGTVKFDGVTYKNLDADVKAQVNYIATVITQMGLNVEFFESPLVNGVRQGENGSYNSTTGTVRIDIAAGLSGKDGVATLLFTAAHELTHVIKVWDPEAYNEFAKFLMAEYEGKVPVKMLIEKKINDSKVNHMAYYESLLAEGMSKEEAIEKANRITPILTRTTAWEEVVCDSCQRFLADGKAGAKLVANAQMDKSLKDKILNFIKDFKDLVQKAINTLKGINPQGDEAKYMSGLESMQKLCDMWDKMLLGAAENIQKTGTNKLIVPDMIKFNQRLFHDNHDKKLASIFKKGHSVTTYDALMGKYKNVVDMWDRISKSIDSDILNEWNNRVGKDRVFEVFKKQLGYKYNAELASMCKKGIPLFEAIDNIVNRAIMSMENIDMIGYDEKQILYSVLKNRGFDIPCAICYVEQSRQREGIIISRFLEGRHEDGNTKLGWNEVLHSIEKGMEKRGVKYTFPSLSRDVSTDAYSPADLSMDKKTQDAFFSALIEEVNKEINRTNEANIEENKKIEAKNIQRKTEGKEPKNLKNLRPTMKSASPQEVKRCLGGSLTENLAIFKNLFMRPQARFLVDGDLLYSSQTITNLKKYHKDFFTLYNRQGGQNGAKTKERTEIYYADILKKKWDRVALREDGGLRNQSNSDFQMYTFLDQCQMYIDLTAQGYYLHAYTKVLEELKLFGLSNAKINASLIPKVHIYVKADGTVDVEKTMANAGLDKDGNLLFDDFEGINHTEAFMLVADENYSKSIATICIGYSDAHIQKLLDDNRIGFIIGYHDKSDDTSKRYVGAKYSKNYNELNEAIDKNGKVVPLHFSKFLLEAESKFTKQGEDFVGTVNHNGKEYSANDIPRFAADLYLEYCADHEYTPAYSRCSIDFSKDKNYYKLLADFGLYDSKGNYAPHKKVNFVMPESVPYLAKDGTVAYQNTEEFIEEKTKAELSVRDRLAEDMDNIVDAFVTEVKKKKTDDGELKLQNRDLSAMAKAAEEHFGVTNNVNESGYITINGKMLDFSGRHWGGDNRGSRQVDHEDASEILPDDFDTFAIVRGGSKKGEQNRNGLAKYEFEKYGFIRTQPETASVELAMLPTEEQNQRLIQFFKRMRTNGEDIFRVELNDIDKNGRLYPVACLKYDRGTSVEMIPLDIAEYYNKGRLPEGVKEYGKSTQDSWKFQNRVYSGSLTQERIDDIISYNSAGSRVDYAAAWIASISPTDFINLTLPYETRNKDREVFDKEVQGDHGSLMGDRDYISDLKNSRQMPRLRIDMDTGKVIGHDGRHRMRALEMVGASRTPIEIIFYKDGSVYKGNNNGERLEAIDVMRLTSQFDDRPYMQTHSYIHDAIPLNEDHRTEIEKLYRAKPVEAKYGYTIAYQNRVTAEEDQAYEDAYFDGDEDAMEELVEKVANRLGYKYKAYHHTGYGFTVFDLSKARDNMDIQGFFFSADKDAEREYGDVRYDTYLKMENPYIVDNYEKYKAIPFDMSTGKAGIIAREWLQSQGYDSVIRKAEYWGAEADEYIVFEPSQIKSAEIVTYADDEYGEGDFIPLSQRFDEGNDDIRYHSRDNEQLMLDGFDDQYFGDQLSLEDMPIQTISTEFDELIEAVKIVIDDIAKNGAWYSLAIRDLYNSNPKTDFIMRIHNNEPDALSSLQRYVAEINDAELLEKIKTYSVRTRNADFRKSHRSAINKYEKVFKERIDYLKSLESGGRNLDFEKRKYYFDEYRDLFYSLNSDENVKELADKVFEVAGKLGLTFYGEGGKYETRYGVNNGREIRIKVDYMNSPRFSDQEKASTLLHELIHSVTTYALWDWKENYSKNIDSDMREACRTIGSIYNEIKYDSSFKDKKGNKLYGITDEYEMIAELSNVEFRKKLEEKGLWQRLVDAIKKLFGIEPKSALEGAEASLIWMLDHYDSSRIREFFREQDQFSKHQSENEFIRYQARFTDDFTELLESELEEDYIEETQIVEEDFETLNELLKLQKQYNELGKYTPTSVKASASQIAEKYGITEYQGELEKQLKEYYAYISKTEDLQFADVYKKAEDIAKWIRRIQPAAQRDERATEILKTLRGKKIYFAEKDKAEAEGVFGTFDAYRKYMFGKGVYIVTDKSKLHSDKNVVTLADAWDSLRSEYGYEFNEESDANMPAKLVEVVQGQMSSINMDDRFDEAQYERDITNNIYDSYWRVSTLKGLDTKYRQKVNRLKRSHKQALDKAKEKREEQRQQYLADKQRKLKEVREQRDRKLREYKEHTAEVRQNERDRRNKSALKTKIKGVVKELEKLEKGGKDKNVKYGMKDAVEKALTLAGILLNDNISNEDILNRDITDYRDGEKELHNEWKSLTEQRERLKEELEALNLKGTTEGADDIAYKIKNFSRSITEIERKLSSLIKQEKTKLNKSGLQDAVDSLARAYASLKDSEISYIKEAYNEHIADRIARFGKEVVDGKLTVADMSEIQLAELYEVYKSVLHTVRDANKIFVKGKKEDVDARAQSTMAEVKRVVGGVLNEHKIDKLKGVRYYVWNELKPVFAFKRIGSEAFEDLFWELRRGEDVYSRDVEEAVDFITDLREKYNANEWDEKKTYEIKATDGRLLKVNLQQLMSLYAYARREQAIKHIMTGGIVFDNNAMFKHDKYGNLVKMQNVSPNAYRLNYETFVSKDHGVVTLLTPDQKAYVEEMQTYLSKVMGAKGNEVSRAMYGIDQFKEEAYIPIISSDSFLPSKSADEKTQGYTVLKNSGFTKDVTPNANNPVVLREFEDIWGSHVNQMSSYHAYVLPIEALTKVYRYSDRDNSTSVRRVLESAYGNEVNTYLERFIRDLNGDVASQGARSLFEKGLANFKMTSVAASTSTVIQQPTAIVRAMALINPKYFVGLKVKGSWDECKKYCPIAFRKEMGGFDSGVGHHSADVITQKTYKGAKEKVKAFGKDEIYRNNLLMWGASKADEIGWGMIWEAVKKEVSATTSLNVGSDEFFQACADRFNKVIVETQVYDSTISRSGYMRSSNALVKMSVAFFGEPTTSVNMMFNAVLQLKRGNIGKLEASRTIGAVVLSIVFASAAKSLIYALRDDDEDESYGEKYVAKLTDSIVNDLLVVTNMLPFLNEITDMVMGYDIERMDVALFKDVFDSVSSIFKDDVSTVKKMENVIGSIGNVFGIPLRNIIRTFRESRNAIAHILDDNKPTKEKLKESAHDVFGETTVADMNEAYDKGDSTKGKEYFNELLNEKIEKYESEGYSKVEAKKKAESSIQSSVTSYWKERYIEAYRNKDSAEMLRIRKILQELRLYKSVADTCSNWIKNSKNKTTEDTESRYNEKW